MLLLLRFDKLFDGFFKLYAVKCEIAPAAFTNYAHVAAHSQHQKEIVSARMLFFHYKDVSNVYFQDLHVAPPPK